MDKSALVDQIKRFLNYLREEQIEVDFASLMPEHTLFRNNQYALVLGAPTLANTNGRTRIIIDKWFAFTTLEERQMYSIMSFRVFPTVEEAIEHISYQDVDEFVIPVLESTPA